MPVFEILDIKAKRRTIKTQTEEENLKAVSVSKTNCSTSIFECFSSFLRGKTHKNTHKTVFV